MVSVHSLPFTRITTSSPPPILIDWSTVCFFVVRKLVLALVGGGGGGYDTSSIIVIYLGWCVYTVNRVCDYDIPIIIATPLMFTTEVKFPVSKYSSMLNTVIFIIF
jgi:hypothetical protein